MTSLIYDESVVLKFGSSVLTGHGGLIDAAAAVASLVADGRRVVCVVSAVGRTTDDLLDVIRAVNSSPAAIDVASTLATGEDAAASLLGIALTGHGVPVSVGCPQSFRLRTRGARLDAQPVALDRDWLLDQFRRVPVIVLPGFVGVCHRGHPTLLGRGGSDLSALFVASELGIGECRLVKDVSGLYTSDPNVADGPPPRRLRRATWSDALRLGQQLVQPKAVRFAEARDQPFFISDVHGGGTEVGSGPSELEPEPGVGDEPFRVTPGPHASWTRQTFAPPQSSC